MLRERTDMEKQQFKGEDMVFLEAQKIIRDYESGLIVNNDVKRKINRMTGYLLLDKSIQNKNDILKLATDLVNTYEKSVNEVKSNNISDFKETLGLKKLEIKMSKLATEIESKIKSREAKKIIEKRLLERSQKNQNEKVVSKFKSDMEVAQINENLKLEDDIKKEIQIVDDIEKNKEYKNNKEEKKENVKNLGEEIENEDLIDKLLRKRRDLKE